LPSYLKFESFTKKDPNGTSEILLHSTSHPTIDFTAAENDTSNDKHLKHYVAVFDPTTGQLEVTEARRLTARSTVRRREVAISEDEAEGEETKAVTNYSSRAALTNTFGTKKSKKAVQSMAENRLLTRGGDDANNPLSKAILFSMPASDIPEHADTRQLAQSNKPLPIPNLDTEDVNLAYPLSSLVFPESSTTLAQMPITPWIDALQKDNAVRTESRFVVSRVAYLTRAHIGSPEDETNKLRVQLLRYTLLLIEISRHIGTLRPHSRIPPPSSWRPKAVTGNLPHSLTSKILSRFFPNFQITTPGVTLLHTTILALTLHIPPPSLQVAPGTLISELSDIQLDLALEPDVCSKYYRELGCKIASASDGEVDLWGLTKIMKKRKTEGREKSLPRPKFAKLTVPFVFPKSSTGRRQGRR
jgi:DNA-directed RNA polymerase I subunit RPA49